MFTFPSSVPPTYEDLETKYETKETPESHLLVVHLPDGFAREHIGAKVEFDVGRVRVFGERPLGNNRSSRFNLLYPVPTSCDINGIKGKFDGGIVTITMQKKVISKEVTNQEPQQTEKEAPKPPVQETNESKPEKNQEGIPPQSTTGDAQEKSTSTEVKDQKVQQVQSKKQVDHDTSNLPKATEKSMPQKGQEISGQDPKPAVQSKEQADHEIHGKSNLPKAIEEPMLQKGQEVISSKDPKTTVQSKQHDDHDTSNLPEATKESMPQKGQQGISGQDTKSTVQSKEQVDHETSKLLKATEESMPQKGQKVGNEEKQKVVKEVTKEDSKNISESGKPPKKDVVDDSPTAGKESKEKGKESTKVEESFVDPKSTKKEKDKEKEKEKNGKFNDGADEESYGKGMLESTVRRIKEVATSTSQAVTSLAKRFNEEDKQKLIYVGAAVVVVALGVCASYKFRSSPRL